MSYKQITVKEETWNRLWDIKRKKKLKSINEVITNILNRDNQGEKR